MPLLQGRGGASQQWLTGTEVVSTTTSLAVVTVVVAVVVNTHLLGRCSSHLGDGV
jgi:hypothetical protein